MRAALLLTLVLLVMPGAAAAVGPTDIARVDDYIDAPRALFGRTRAELERRLGAPMQERPRAGTIVLSWPGLEVAVSRSARVAAVIVRAAGRPLPHGLDVGARARASRRVLGAAQDTTDERAVYLDADGFRTRWNSFSRRARHADRVALLDGVSALRPLRRAVDTVAQRGLDDRAGQAGSHGRVSTATMPGPSSGGSGICAVRSSTTGTPPIPGSARNSVSSSRLSSTGSSRS